jgi:ATP-binding cassette subfamily B protein
MDKRSGVLLGVATVAGTAAQLAVPAATGRAVDARTGAALALAAVLIAAQVASDAACQWAVGAGTAAGTALLRERALRHLLAAGPALTRRLTPGDLTSRIVGSAADAGAGFPAAVQAAAATAAPVLAVGALALLDPWLAVAFLAGLPAVVLLLRGFVRDTAAIVLRYQRAQGAIASALLEALGGARTIAAAGTADREVARVLRPLPDLDRYGRRTWQVQGRVAAQATLAVPLLLTAVLAAGGAELAAGRLTPGGLLAAAQYAMLGSGFGAGLGHLARWARARAGAARLGEVLAAPAPAYGDRALPAGAGMVEFRGVRAGLLSGVDLTVPGGIAVALVGASGSGKSTLAALVGRLRDPEDGEVLLDGVPVGALSAEALRTAVSYAFARPVLVGETAGDAIGYGPAPPPWAQVRAAARAACADGFVTRLPGGYDTPLPAVPLSGGEAQRLGLARAFARLGPAGRVLVLDDATGSLDTATELQVTNALTRAYGDRTRLVVAHRAGTAARCDRVVWLDGGRVRAQGTHGELWADPDYRALFGATG